MRDSKKILLRLCAEKITNSSDRPIAIGILEGMAMPIIAFIKE
jgi:hypothetical protein